MAVTVANGRKTIHERPKQREAKSGWTGHDPKRRQLPLNRDHADHILFIRDLWDAGELDLIPLYTDDLIVQGFAPQIVTSILSQGTQGLPGLKAQENSKPEEETLAEAA